MDKLTMQDFVSRFTYMINNAIDKLKIAIFFNQSRKLKLKSFLRNVIGGFF